MSEAHAVSAELLGNMVEEDIEDIPSKALPFSDDLREALDLAVEEGLVEMKSMDGDYFEARMTEFGWHAAYTMLFSDWLHSVDQLEHEELIEFIEKHLSLSDEHQRTRKLTELAQHDALTRVLESYHYTDETPED